MRARHMLAFYIGTLGFVLYFLYDANSILWKRREMQTFFLAGTVVLFAGTALMMAQNLRMPLQSFQYIFGGLALLFFLLLIYTLFFALPFQETYVEENQPRKVYTEGMYALCRHPGVLWLGGLYLCLWGMTGNFAGGYFFLAMIWYDFAYVVYQDFWVFPNTFPDYPQYREMTPFLLPTPASIQRCLSTLIRR